MRGGRKPQRVQTIVRGRREQVGYREIPMDSAGDWRISRIPLGLGIRPHLGQRHNEFNRHLSLSVRPTERGGRRQYDKAWFLKPMPCIAAIGMHRYVAASISFQLSLKTVVEEGWKVNNNKNKRRKKKKNDNSWLQRKTLSQRSHFLPVYRNDVLQRTHLQRWIIDLRPISLDKYPALTQRFSSRFLIITNSKGHHRAREKKDLPFVADEHNWSLASKPRSKLCWLSMASLDICFEKTDSERERKTRKNVSCSFLFISSCYCVLSFLDRTVSLL